MSARADIEIRAAISVVKHAGAHRRFFDETAPVEGGLVAVQGAVVARAQAPDVYVFER